MIMEEILKSLEKDHAWNIEQVKTYTENVARLNETIKAERKRCREVAKKYGWENYETDHLRFLQERRNWNRSQLRKYRKDAVVSLEKLEYWLDRCDIK